MHWNGYGENRGALVRGHGSLQSMGTLHHLTLQCRALELVVEPFRMVHCFVIGGSPSIYRPVEKLMHELAGTSKKTLNEGRHSWTDKIQIVLIVQWALILNIVNSSRRSL